MFVTSAILDGHPSQGNSIEIIRTLANYYVTGMASARIYLAPKFLFFTLNSSAYYVVYFKMR
jgi:hypothetical protein